MIVNVYKNSVGSDYETIKCNSRITIKEAIGERDWDNTLIFCNGSIVDKDYKPFEEDVVCVRTFPSAVAGYVAAGIFVAAVVIWDADLIVTSCTGKHIHEHIGDWVNSLTAETSNSTSSSSTETIPTMKGAKNSSGYGKPIPLVLGKCLFTPYYQGNPYTTISTDDDGYTQIYHAMYILGYNDIKVENIKLDQILIASNEADETDGYIENDSGYSKYDDNIVLEIRDSDELETYNQKVVQEDLNIELLHTEDDEEVLELDRFSATNPQKIQIEFYLPSLYQYNDSGDMEDASVSVGISISFDGGSTYTPFGKITNCSSYTISGTLGVSTITRAKNKNMRFIAERSLSKTEALSCINNGDSVAFIHIERTSTDSTDTKVSDTIYLSAIRTWCFNKTSLKEDGVYEAQVPVIEKIRKKTTRLAVTITATKLLKGQLDELNMILTSRCRTWNGSEWSDEDDLTATANPASVALRVMQSPMLGSHVYSDDEIDLEAFGYLYEYCENQTYTNSYGVTTDMAFTCGNVLISQKKISEVIDVILATCKAYRVLNGNKYSVFVDTPQTVPVTILNNHNILSEDLENSKEFEELPDGYKIKFVDKDNGYEEGEFYCMYDGKDYTDTDAVIENVEFPFVTDYRQAYKLGRYELAKRKLRPEIWTRKVGLEGALIEIGSLVSIQDDTISVGIGDGGEIISVNLDSLGSSIESITTDSYFEVTDLTKSYAVQLMHFDITNGRKFAVRTVVFEETGRYNTLTFSVPISLDETILPVVGDFISFGVYGKITTDALCFGKKDDGKGHTTLTLVPYADGVYTADEGTIPDYDPKITSIKPISGVSEDIEETYVTKAELVDVTANVESVRSVTMWFYLSDSQFKLVGGEWTTDTVTWEEGKYIWTKCQTEYTDDTVTWSSAVCITGSRGQSGLSVYLDTSSFSWLVDSDNNAQGQTIAVKAYATLNGVQQTVRITGVGDDYDPLTYTIDGDTIYFTVAENETITSGKIPIYVDYFVTDDMIVYTTEEDSDNVYSNTSGELYAVFDEDTKISYCLYFTYGTTTTGTYRGILTDVTNIYLRYENGTRYKGDYFTWGNEEDGYVVYEASEYTFVMGCVYRWNGSAWVEDTRQDDNIVAFSDVLSLLTTEIASNNSTVNETINRLVANTIFVKTLVASTAFIQQLFANRITLQNDGVIQSQTYVESGGKSGFYIDADGKSVFNNGTFTGEINATSGIFRGSIEAGPLILNLQSVGTQYFSASSGSLIYDFGNNNINGVFNQNLTYAISGTFNGSSCSSFSYNVKTATSTYTYRGEGYGSMGEYVYGGELYIVTVTAVVYTFYYNNTSIMGSKIKTSISQTSTNSMTVDEFKEYKVWKNQYSAGTEYKGSFSGATNFSVNADSATFKLTNLPITKPSTTGVVWRDGEYLKIVT